MSVEALVNVRNMFAGLDIKVNKYPLIYFDNAATSLRLKSVIERLRDAYTFMNGNIHRAVHDIAERATLEYEKTRSLIASYLNADPEEIFFVKNATEGINVIANGLAWGVLKKGDKVLLTEMEHHANIVPWQMVREKFGIEICVAPVTGNGDLDIEAFEKIISTDERIKVASFTHMSNVTGAINDIKQLCTICHRYGVIVVVDGAQAFAHFPVNVGEIGCDFYVFSAHKAYGPFGVGVVYGKRALLEKIYPYLGGGSMIEEVTFEKTTFTTIPLRFEAGTPPVAEVIAFAPAIEFLKEVFHNGWNLHEHQLTEYALSMLQEFSFVKIAGAPSRRGCVIGFNLENAHHYDVGTLLNKFGIAVRTGHHCAQPLHRKLGVDGTVRISFAIYNTREEVERFMEVLPRVWKMLT